MSPDNNNNDGSWLAPEVNSDNIPKQWPPQPQRNASAADGDETVLINCPHCNRKLLSTRSVMCNWCGQRIDNPEYLEKAAQERAAQDAHERDEVELELNITARLGVRGYLKQQSRNPMRPNTPLFYPDNKPRP